MRIVRVPEGKLHPGNPAQRMGFRDFVIQHQTAVRNVIRSRVRPVREPCAPEPDDAQTQDGKEEDGGQEHPHKRSGESGFLVRKLCQDNGGQHQGTAKEFPGGQPVMENQYACQGRKDGFHAHQKGDDGGVRILLGEDLQGIGHAAGEHAHIEDRPQPFGSKGGVRESVGEGAQGGQDGHHKELTAGQSHAVHLLPEMVHGHDLDGEAERAQKDVKIPGGNRKSVCNTKAVQPAHGQDDADPDHTRRFPSQQQAQHRHQYDIQSRNKARLARGSGFQALLLKKAGHG